MTTFFEEARSALADRYALEEEVGSGATALVYLARDMYEDAQTFFEKTLKLGPNLIEAYYELGRAQWFSGDTDGAKATWDEG